MLPVKKIYVDTKYKTHDSVSISHFKIQLPETLLMPDNCVFYIDDVCIPHSWYTIETGINDKFYFHVSNNNPDEDLRPNQNYAVTIDSKMYTGADLATEIQYRMNAVVNATDFVVTFNASKSSISIASSVIYLTFKILTHDDITTKLEGWWVPDSPSDNYDSNNPLDINTDMLKQAEGNSPYYTVNNPFVSGYLNLPDTKKQIHYLY